MACPSTEDPGPDPLPVSGLVPVLSIPPGHTIPEELDGDAFAIDVVADSVLSIDADNDERQGDLYVMVFDATDTAVAGPGVDDFRFEFFNADWGCSNEPANNPPERPRGCPDNSFVAPSTGEYTVVIAAHDGTETTVGYTLQAFLDDIPLPLSPSFVP